jgi:hypothetical protein
MLKISFNLYLFLKEKQKINLKYKLIFIVSYPLKVFLFLEILRKLYKIINY